MIPNCNILAHLFDETRVLLGSVDILINNAAHCEDADTLCAIDGGVIDRHSAVNVRAAILLSQQLAWRCRERDAQETCIVNISTDAARGIGIGIPENVAGAVAFLCSYQARWITGQVVQVAGGHVV